MGDTIGQADNCYFDAKIKHEPVEKSLQGDPMNETGMSEAMDKRKAGGMILS
jgi:hypothetical protein